MSEETKEFTCPVHGVPLKTVKIRAIMHKPNLVKFMVCPRCGYLATFLLKPSQTVVVAGREVTQEVSFG